MGPVTERFLKSAGPFRPRYVLYIIVFAIAFFVVVPLTIEAIGTGKIAPAAPFYGSILITFGWVVTSEIAIRNAKRQHTITLITQQQFDPQRQLTREIIKKKLPSYRNKLTAEIADFDDERDVFLKAIDLELNFYEFVAAGVSRDDLDEKLLIQTIRTQFINFYEQCELYIAHWQAGNASTWINITNMYNKWKKL